MNSLTAQNRQNIRNYVRQYEIGMQNGNGAAQMRAMGYTVAAVRQAALNYLDVIPENNDSFININKAKLLDYPLNAGDPYAAPMAILNFAQLDTHVFTVVFLP